MDGYPRNLANLFVTLFMCGSFSENQLYWMSTSVPGNISNKSNHKVGEVSNFPVNCFPDFFILNKIIALIDFLFSYFGVKYIFMYVYNPFYFSITV